MREIAIGIITAWAGAIGNIPPRWHLCDGTNGTPDLRDKFIPATGPTFSVDDEGGTVVHTHLYSTDGHDHTIPAGTDIQTAPGRRAITIPFGEEGTTNAGLTWPPYYALAYIQYLGA